MDAYDPKQIEPKWQKFWEDRGFFKVKEDPSKKKYYLLEMLPYPSGRIHMGHVRNYTIGDVACRYRKMRGFDVLHPMGWDAFGLPAENAAIKQKTHPAKWTHENIDTMRAQLQSLGFSYDWDREVATCDPDYYRWEQLVFLKMFAKGLVYRKASAVNWCAGCETVLANEQVVAGKCWRCDTPVTQKKLEQWYFKITDYTEELLNDIDDKLQGWPERVKAMQKEWIGKSEGCEIDFEVEVSKEKIRVFTTRPDTIFGVTFMALACEHPLLLKLAEKGGCKREIEKFIAKTAKIERMKRLAGEYEKEGELTGAYCLHPVTKARLPIYAANFVLMDYGTGAIMGVPGHDERDFEFAKKYNLPVKKLEEFVEAKGLGKKTVTFRLKDWLISRQRYWGTPIPVIYCKKCGIVPVPEKDLPVILPKDVSFSGKGGSSLAKHKAFVETKCPQCKAVARRETDTMDTFVESSWYFLRYISPKYNQGPVDPKEAAYWMPIDQYIGGIEHAVGHLIYCRFFTKVLRDLGFLKLDEPVKNLMTQGMVCLGGAAMSKSRGNIVDPDQIIEKYGADTARLFILFAAPVEKDLEWSDEAVEGMWRFLGRVWKGTVDRGPWTMDQQKEAWKHKTIKRVTEDIEKFHFNTAIAALMEYLNSGEMDAETMVILLSPFAPHMAEELWAILGRKESVLKQPWPQWDPKFLENQTMQIVVQVNGKLRGDFEVDAGASEEVIKQKAQELEKVRAHTAGKQIKKIIYVPKKLVNIVVC
ncbi:MAG: leucine--tRNA ligase [Deltaproteobacteria bacterium]|nr:leucine--tRNA ligase [Deltaproteobacteria bacterium]